jgi:hypothetical protein
MAAKEYKRKCVWEWVDNGARYETACENGADHYNEVKYFKFCPYCGWEIEVTHAD